MQELKIVCERREGYGPLKRVRSSNEVYDTFKEHFNILDREEFLVLLLNAKNCILGFNIVSVGTLTSSLVHPREVFKPPVIHNDMVKEQYNGKELTKEVCEQVIRRSAANLILMHNHPSGDPLPSQEDIAITRRLRDIGEMMGVKVLDHIVFGDRTYISFVDDGYWDK
jgi:DNA repair protein RadC